LTRVEESQLSSAVPCLGLACACVGAVGCDLHVKWKGGLKSMTTEGMGQ
jgi:hypothetical protein